MNSITICGFLTAEPKYTVKNISGETVAVCDMSISADDGKEAEYFRVSAWRTKAEECAKRLMKGDKVLVRGPVKLKKFVDSKQQFCANMEVRADFIEFFDEVLDTERNKEPVTYETEDIF